MVAQLDPAFKAISKRKTFTRLISYLFYEGRPLTTKGRWINPFVFLLYRFQRHLPFAKIVKDPVFILGTGRSGTTILGVTLGIHRDVGFLNEPKALWAYAYESEDLIGSYNDGQAFYSINPDEATIEVKKRLHRVFGHYLRFSASSRVVDKYPELIFRVPFVREVFPGAKFIFLFRNGFDTCTSIEHWSARLGVTKDGEIHDWWGKDDRKWKLLCDQIVAEDTVLGKHAGVIRAYSDHKLRAAVEWIVTMKKGLELTERYPEIVLPVRYEDYVGEERVRDQVIEFCGLDEDKNYSEYCKAVLTPVEPKAEISLPPEIQSEFSRVMSLLGYER